MRVLYRRELAVYEQDQLRHQDPGVEFHAQETGYSRVYDCAMITSWIILFDRASVGLQFVLAHSEDCQVLADPRPITKNLLLLG